MNPLLQEFLVTILRKALTIGATWLVAQGWLGAGDEEKYAAGFALLLVSLLWSFWERYKGRVLFLTALEAQPGTTEATVKERAAKLPPGAMVLLLVLGLWLPSGCALSRSAPLVIGQATLGTAQAIGQVQLTGEQLERAGILPTATALQMQTKLLSLNQRVSQVNAVLKALDAAAKVSGGKVPVTQLDEALAILEAVSADLAVVVAGVPISTATAQLIELVRGAQQTLATSLVEVARIREAVAR